MSVIAELKLYDFFKYLAIQNEHHAISGRIVDSIGLEIRGGVPHIFTGAGRNMENIMILNSPYLLVEV